MKIMKPRDELGTHGLVTSIAALREIKLLRELCAHPYIVNLEDVFLNWKESTMHLVYELGAFCFCFCFCSGNFVLCVASFAVSLRHSHVRLGPPHSHGHGAAPHRHPQLHAPAAVRRAVPAQQLGHPSGLEATEHSCARAVWQPHTQHRR